MRLVLNIVTVLMVAIGCIVPVASKANVVFYNVNDLFGISIRETSSIALDSRGFTWVSSKTGVLRLSVDDYKVYQLPLQTANVISVQLAYAHHSLYAITNNGQVFSYNALSDKFEIVINFGQVLNNPFLYVHGSLIDPEGTLWLATDMGLLGYSNGEHRFIGETGSVDDISIFTGSTVLVARGPSIIVYNTKNNVEERVLLELPGRGIRISKLYIDEIYNRLWIGTVSSGLYVFNLITSELTRVIGIPNQPVLAIEPFNSVMLAGVDGQGLWEVSRENLTVIHNFRDDPNNPNSLRGNGVYDILHSPAGRVWVATHSGGVSFFDPTPTMIQRFTRLVNEPNSLVNNDVNDILEDSSGNLWFATNNGLSRFEVKTGRWSSFYSDKDNARVFLALSEDLEGNIWAGGYAAGLYVINALTGREVDRFPREGALFNNNFVFDIILDKDGKIWVAGVRGELFSYNPLYGTFEGFGEHPVYSMKVLDENTLLLGCSYGLSRLDKRTGVVEILLYEYLVHDLYIQGDEVWLSTVGEGLVRYNLSTTETKSFTVENAGLPSNFVNSIVFSNGKFWLGTENGICRFNPVDMSVETFPAIRVLSGASFNRGAGLVKRNGDLIWGTNRGVVTFNPEYIEKTPPEGQIFFQDILILGRSIRQVAEHSLSKPVDSIGKLTLNHHQSTISLEMIPLGMNYGTKFSWFLEGFDTEWSRPVARRVLNYTNIPKGNYTLRIRMFDNSMLNIIDEREIEIKKLPPYWQSWWFLLLVAAFLLGIFYISLKYYIGLIKQLHSEEKIRFFANTAHDMRTALTLIKAPIHELETERELTPAGRYYLSLAKGQASRLATFVSLLMDFHKADVGKERLVLNNVDLVRLVAERVKIFEVNAILNKVKLEFKTDQKVILSAVDTAMIERVVDNLISNAVKFSKAGGVVDVILSVDNSYWQIDVKDNGIGISKEVQQQLFKEFYRGDNAIDSRISGSGIGLVLAKKYITMHGGSISCTSNLNEGSNFKVRVPINETDGGFGSSNFSGWNESSNFDDPPNDDYGSLSDVERQNLPSILIVEDYDDLKGFLVKSLETEFDVLSASDGEEAWQVINEEMPDLIVSDVMMPKMDGFELCKLVKSTFKTSHIPVILLTALSEQSDQLHGLGLGADDYLMKPFNTTLLKQRIKTIIANRVATREKALSIVKGGEQAQILINKLNDQFVKRALEIVQENIANPGFSKDSFASAMNVSPSLLYKKLKSTIDQSPIDFIKSVRLTNAVTLLQTRSHTITEVSEMCGFSSVGYFSTVFKKQFGKSPTEMFD